MCYEDVLPAREPHKTMPVHDGNRKVIDLLKGLPLKYLVLTEGKPYKHIVEGGLMIVDSGLSKKEVQEMRDERQNFIKSLWDKE